MRSPRTRATYPEALRRFDEWLATLPAAPATTDELTTDLAERWMGALVASGKRASLTTFGAGLRAYLHFLARRGLAPNMSSDQVRALLGRPAYRSPRIDQRLPLVVLYADGLPLPHPARRRGLARLELLRDRALLHVLFGTGMRRAEVAALSRADVGEGLLELGEEHAEGVRHARAECGNADKVGAVEQAKSKPVGRQPGKSAVSGLALGATS